jgi:hypothetical protein
VVDPDLVVKAEPKSVLWMPQPLLLETTSQRGN